MGTRTRLGLVALILLTISLCTTGKAAPSKQLQLLLDTKLPSAVTETTSLINAVFELEMQLRSEGMSYLPRIGVECIQGRPEPRLKAAIPDGTLREQMNCMAKNAGYVWFVDGDWINLVPADRAHDPDYIMNRRIPGKIVLGRTSGQTVLHDWLRANNVSVAREVHTLRFASEKPGYPDPLCPDPTVLQNPTLRQCGNTHESLYGNGRCVTNIWESPGAHGRPEGIAITVSGQPLYPRQVTNGDSK